MMWPDFDEMIRTIQKEVTKEEIIELVKHLPMLLKLQMNIEHIPENIFDDLGFPLDTDSKGQ
eukprot:7812302-Ditylum_brightwellii.AAC.1